MWVANPLSLMVFAGELPVGRCLILGGWIFFFGPSLQIHPTYCPRCIQGVDYKGAPVPSTEGTGTIHWGGLILMIPAFQFASLGVHRKVWRGAVGPFGVWRVRPFGWFLVFVSKTEASANMTVPRRNTVNHLFWMVYPMFIRDLWETVLSFLCSNLSSSS